MKKIDYEKLGLKCGIEIHQQLEGKKLFCNSPTIIRDDTPDYEISRKIRAVIGESGKVDEAAKAEMAKGKTYVYQGYTDTIGLVELDEEPPHSVNQDALKTALQVAKLLNGTLVDEMQIMRKTVVDGSNTSGFQRTCLIAQNGYVKTATGKKIDIPTIILEEDACKIVERAPDQVTYNLSRLGIPLIELGTDPQITSGEEAKEVAQQLGMILRATGGVKRGLGTIRQDVNVSITGGNRVEIKGAQDLQGVPTIVDYEIIRQVNILELKETFVKMKLSEPKDVTEFFTNTDCKFVATGIKNNLVFFGVKVPNANGIIGREIQPAKRVGSDLSDFAKVHVGIGGIIHSDEDLTKYHFSLEEMNAVQTALSIGSNDAFILILNDIKRVKRAFEKIQERIDMLAQGVPQEVRKANQDYSSTYMRPMPGEARMYPETDALPVTVDDSQVVLPELLDVKIERYKKLGLATDLATAIGKGTSWDLFDKAVTSFSKVKPTTIAELIESIPKNLKRKEKIDFSWEKESLQGILSALEFDKIVISSVQDIIIASQSVSLEKAIQKYETMSDADLQSIINSVKADHKDAPMGLLMGKVMALTKGKADGKKVSELLKRV